MKFLAALAAIVLADQVIPSQPTSDQTAWSSQSDLTTPNTTPNSSSLSSYVSASDSTQTSDPTQTSESTQTSDSTQTIPSTNANSATTNYQPDGAENFSSPGSFQKRTVVNCRSGQKSKWGFLTVSADECLNACMQCRAELTEEAFSDCITFRNATECRFRWLSVYETYSAGCMKRESGLPTIIATSYSYFPKKYIEHADQIVVQPMYAYPSPDIWQNLSLPIWGEVILHKTNDNVLLRQPEICQLFDKADWTKGKTVPLAFNVNDNRLEFDITPFQDELRAEVPNTVVFFTRTNATDNIRFIFPTGKLLTRRNEGTKYFEATPDA
eukprot:Gregarina_sp_Pseudo_9__447@NODE_128_length_4108_cov_13_891865_g120_i0_p2_GENE_NODE_128_length_4108_cov_13_891865_g120_i0NODE_128_length_4108_cov_13_891865_g120_i0_p2_ORF_typecomplete_len326_score29_64_NODE_128_length_4108_cov_13_891865_g120_i030424019